MSERAWTLGYPPAYEKAVRTAGNGKAPGGYLFPTRAAAENHAATHDDARRYAPFEIELPAPYGQVATRDYGVAAAARHRWHTSDDDPRDPAVPFMEACGVCRPRTFPPLDHDVLTVVAPFINPDTGLPALTPTRRERQVLDEMTRPGATA